MLTFTCLKSDSSLPQPNEWLGRLLKTLISFTVFSNHPVTFLSLVCLTKFARQRDRSSSRPLASHTQAETIRHQRVVTFELWTVTEEGNSRSFSIGRRKAAVSIVLRATAESSLDFQSLLMDRKTSRGSTGSAVAESSACSRAGGRRSFTSGRSQDPRFDKPGLNVLKASGLSLGRDGKYIFLEESRLRSPVLEPLCERPRSVRFIATDASD